MRGNARPPRPWSTVPATRDAIAEAVRAVKGHCDTYDPDAVIGVLVERGLVVIPNPEPPGRTGTQPTYVLTEGDEA